MLTLKTYTPANASGIVEDADGNLMSISFPGFEPRPVELRGNFLRLVERAMSEGQAVMHHPTQGDIVYVGAGDQRFSDEAELVSFLKGKHDDHLREGSPPSRSHLQALNLLNLLRQLTA